MAKTVEQPIFSEDELKLKSLANEDCSKCYGTGRKKIVINQFAGGARTLIPCKCVVPALEEEAKKKSEADEKNEASFHQKEIPKSEQVTDCKNTAVPHNIAASHGKKR